MTAQYWVYFFLAVSVLSLIVAFFFARQVIGAIKEGAKAFLKRQYKTVAALLGLLLLPAFAGAQEPRAAKPT